MPGAALSSGMAEAARASQTLRRGRESFVVEDLVVADFVP
jgi:hypothetical protein